MTYAMNDADCIITLWDKGLGAVHNDKVVGNSGNGGGGGGGSGSDNSGATPKAGGRTAAAAAASPTD